MQIELDMKEIIKMINMKGKEYFIIKMEIYMKKNIKMVSQREKEYIIIIIILEKVIDVMMNEKMVTKKEK